MKLPKHIKQALKDLGLNVVHIGDITPDGKLKVPEKTDEDAVAETVNEDSQMADALKNLIDAVQAKAKKKEEEEESSVKISKVQTKEIYNKLMDLHIQESFSQMRTSVIDDFNELPLELAVSYFHHVSKESACDCGSPAHLTDRLALIHITPIFIARLKKELGK